MDLVYPFSLRPSINLNDIQELMRIDSDFIEPIKKKTSVFWKKTDDEIKKEFTTQIKRFYLIFQIEYYKLGDEGKTKPYYYSAKYLAFDKSTKFAFIESISGNKAQVFVFENERVYSKTSKTIVKPYPN